MCPECGDPLVVFELESVEVDRCVSCGGTWLDAGELERIAELAGVEPGGFQRLLDSGRIGVRSQRRCPRCSRKLRTVSLDTQRRIELDRCPLGDGLWFDQGEMLAVISSMEGGEEGAVAAFFSELYRSELAADKDSTDREKES